jgi:hypothetical protein
MKRMLIKARPSDFEEFGYQTMLECNDVERATKICGLHLHAYEDELRPELRRRNSEIAEVKNRAGALHGSLYDRPEPVNDAQMLSHQLKARIFLGFAMLAAIACLVGNMTTFYLLGFGLLLTIASGAGLTALPLVVGHLAYEWIISASRLLQIVAVVVAVILTSAGILMVGQARSGMVDRSVSAPAANSYVDGADAAKNQTSGQEPDEISESSIHRTLGEAMLLIMIAADLSLAFIVGLLVRMYTNDDYTAWRKLRNLAKSVISLEERVSELMTLPEVAKKRCLAGILQAQTARSRRRPPYHRALTMLLIVVSVCALPSWAQTVERYDGILIDTSKSISRGGKTNKLFQKYLTGTTSLLLTEPPSSRVWVSSISTDSFGGTHEILKGWTPDSRGAFTDGLRRARAQLALAFGHKSAEMAPAASNTDIFGALWRLQIVLESESRTNGSRPVSKSIWIFSDMINDTKAFPMPDMIKLGPQLMLERARAEGLVVPLRGYQVRVYGASTSGMIPQTWITVKRFWTMYFVSSGATLVSYSSECDLGR